MGELGSLNGRRHDHPTAEGGKVALRSVADDQNSSIPVDAAINSLMGCVDQSRRSFATLL